MTKTALTAACVVLMPFALAVTGFTAGSLRNQAPPAPAAAPAAVPPQRALLDRYCVSCHNQRAKAAGQEPARKLTLDDLDIARISDHAEEWERVVRKLRAGMMPPAGARRPDKAAMTQPFLAHPPQVPGAARAKRRPGGDATCQGRRR